MAGQPPARVVSPRPPVPILGERAHYIRVEGNTHGLKASQLKRLERLTRRRLAPERLVTHELARELTELSRETGRQVGVLVDRGGAVTHVMVGSATSIEMPDWGRMRAGLGRLRGLRCLHTTLGGEPLTRDDLTDLAKLRLDAMATIGVEEDGLPGPVHVAALRPASDEGDGVERLRPALPSRLDLDFTQWIREREEELARTRPARAVGTVERAILVVVTAGRDHEETEYSTDELRELARTAGVEVVDVLVQSRRHPDPKTAIGSGKLQDLMIRCFQSDVDLVIFDDALTPVQARNLGERLDLRVIDRTQLILDIFAQRANTRDGKLQVELAQLQYVLPRLAQRDTSLSRLGGGIGGRGPGETKLEIDRRRVRERITRLTRDLRQLEQQRAHRRARRARRGLPVLSIVGYTNAGKSTLLRALTRTETRVEDKLFATLDPASRRLRLPQDREAIVTDTVGFIRDLPPQLVAAFHATLEELREADLFLHVVDASSPALERRIRAVRGVLEEMGLDGVPELLVFNKIDRLPPGEGARLARSYGASPISAHTGTGLVELVERAEAALFEARTESTPALQRAAGRG